MLFCVCDRVSRAHSFFVIVVNHPSGECTMYAVIESGSKQYRVAEGDIIRVESLALAKGDTVELDRVLMISDDSTTTVGTPTVAGARVVATVHGHGRMPKIIVY